MTTTFWIMGSLLLTGYAWVFGHWCSDRCLRRDYLELLDLKNEEIEMWKGIAYGLSERHDMNKTYQNNSTELKKLWEGLSKYQQQWLLFRVYVSNRPMSEVVNIEGVPSDQRAKELLDKL